MGNVDFKTAALPDGGWEVAARSDLGELGYGSVSLEGDSGIIRLDRIHVYPPFRGLGIAPQIFNRLVQLGEEQGALVLIGDFAPDFGDEEPARSFYGKMGVAIDEGNKLFKKLL